MQENVIFVPIAKYPGVHEEDDGQKAFVIIDLKNWPTINTLH